VDTFLSGEDIIELGTNKGKKTSRELERYLKWSKTYDCSQTNADILEMMTRDIVQAIFFDF